MTRDKQKLISEIEQHIDEFLGDLGRLAIYAEDNETNPWEYSVAKTGHGIKQKLITQISESIERDDAEN